MASKKANTRKTIVERVDGNSEWTVQRGRLKRGQGNPGKTEHLFRVLGEKIPFEFLGAVKKDLKEKLGIAPYGVYVAHDSMGCPRYIGRGNVFGRLDTRRRAQVLELRYFSSIWCRRKNMSAKLRRC